MTLSSVPPVGLSYGHAASRRLASDRGAGIPLKRERNGSGTNREAWVVAPSGNEKTPCYQGVFAERATRFELATLTLAR